jgi:UDP-N-acetylmuramate--alanine ligase
MTIHFVGIGGIGVSALAKYYLSQGAKISGSDLVSSEITEELEKLGAKIVIGKHKRTNVPQDTSLVIYTSATPKDNPELKAAKLKHLKVQSYPEAIGELTKRYETITISGAHGKSTTTALTALVLEEGYFDPTVIVGTKIKEFGNSNFRQGRGSHLVLEADEWNRSFLQYFPKIAVITNIDAEHLDTYKNISGVEHAFEKYLSRVPRDGAIVANYDDPRTRKVAGKFGRLVQWYSLADWDVSQVKKALRIPGLHNVLNALAAVRVGRMFGIKEGHILQALSRFGGCWRRFEFVGVAKGAFIFSDYGHHPAEIHATITAARERFPFRRIWCVYQPHQYQRLYYLWKEFMPAFDMADRIVLLPVYDVAGRETKSAREKVDSKKLAMELRRRGKNTSYLDSLDEAHRYLMDSIRPGDVILVMGAGDIYKLAHALTIIVSSAKI